MGCMCTQHLVRCLLSSPSPNKVSSISPYNDIVLSVQGCRNLSDWLERCFRSPVISPYKRSSSRGVWESLSREYFHFPGPTNDRPLKRCRNVSMWYERCVRSLVTSPCQRSSSEAGDAEMFPCDTRAVYVHLSHLPAKDRPLKPGMQECFRVTREMCTFTCHISLQKDRPRSSSEAGDAGMFPCDTRDVYVHLSHLPAKDRPLKPEMQECFRVTREMCAFTCHISLPKIVLWRDAGTVPFQNESVYFHLSPLSIKHALCRKRRGNHLCLKWDMFSFSRHFSQWKIVFWRAT